MAPKPTASHTNRLLPHTVSEDGNPEAASWGGVGSRFGLERDGRRADGQGGSRLGVRQGLETPCVGRLVPTGWQEARVSFLTARASFGAAGVSPCRGSRPLQRQWLGERRAGQRDVFRTDSRISLDAPIGGSQVASLIVTCQMRNVPRVSNLHPAVLVLCLAAYRTISI